MRIEEEFLIARQRKMTDGRLLEIYVTPRRRGQPQAVEEVEAVAGRGLRGDHYFRQDGAGQPSQEVTLIESESLEFLEREYDIQLESGQTRRNLVTQGIALNDLVGQKFAIGAVVLHGIELCQPCRHLESFTVADIKKALYDR